MLELRGVCFTTTKSGEETDLLHEISLAVPKQHFMAVVGPSGCGKTTLLKIVAGILEETQGSLHWDGRDLAEDADLESAEIGYVPQFSVAYEVLTVEESVDSAVQLRVRTADRKQVEQIADIVLEQTGLKDLADRRVAVLSGGQKRRLGLALELVSNPRLLLCDEVTSGLDPRSEKEIVQLLHHLSQMDERIVVNVTHSLAHLELYDSILVLYEGCAVYHGDPQSLAHYFSVEHPEDVYPQLALRDSIHWHVSWQKHRSSYYQAAGIDSPAVEGENPKVLIPREDRTAPPSPSTTTALRKAMGTGEDSVPGPWRQFAVLLGRRFTIFLRARGQFFLQAALLLGFPALVVLFTPGLLEPGEGTGIPPMPNQLSSSEIIQSPNMAQQLTEAQEIAGQQFQLGVLLSGLVMFQVILLALMGSNNGAREIVSERAIFEKEKLAGLSPLSYLMSKIAFLGLLCLAQSAWMAVFVNHFTSMPGSLGHQWVLLFLVTASMTAVCLAISSLSSSTEQASLLSVYLVGFQLPLSNAVLALPPIIATLTQPFVAAYWGWSGQLDHLVRTTAYDVGIEKAVPTSLTAFEICVTVLLAHVAISLFVALIGVHRHRWD